MLANMKALEPEYNDITRHSQRGFVPGRSFLNNLLDVDSASRISALKYLGAPVSIQRSVRNLPVSRPLILVLPSRPLSTGGFGHF